MVSKCGHNSLSLQGDDLFIAAWEYKSSGFGANNHIIIDANDTVF